MNVLTSELKSLAGQWASFEFAVLPTNAGAVQRQEMRRAFYAGAKAACAIALNDSVSIDPTVGLRMIDHEADEFAARVKAGRA